MYLLLVELISIASKAKVQSTNISDGSVILMKIESRRVEIYSSNINLYKSRDWEVPLRFISPMPGPKARIDRSHLSVNVVNVLFQPAHAAEGDVEVYFSPTPAGSFSSISYVGFLNLHKKTRTLDSDAIENFMKWTQVNANPTYKYHKSQ